MPRSPPKSTPAPPEAIPWKKKAIYLHHDGHLYCRETATDNAVQLASLNMSWVGLDLFDTVAELVYDRSRAADPAPCEIT